MRTKSPSPFGGLLRVGFACSAVAAGLALYLYFGPWSHGHEAEWVYALILGSTVEAGGVGLSLIGAAKFGWGRVPSVMVLLCVALVLAGYGLIWLRLIR